MLSIRDVIILEDLEPDLLQWKAKTWYGNSPVQQANFKTMLKRALDENPVTLDKFAELLDTTNVQWQDFVQFAMDNVDGTEEFDQLYIMKKIVDLLKFDELKESKDITEDIVQVSDLEVTYTTEDGNLFIQVPENYNEDNIKMYLDDRCMSDMPSNFDELSDIIGEDNTQNITDAYFQYDNLTIPEDATQEPDLEWDKRNDNKEDKNAKLILYSLDNLKYVIKFDKFTINDKGTNVKDVLKELFINLESNKLHPWAFEIKLENISYK